MKKLCFVLVLFVTIFSQINAQIFYNIEMPPSYHKTEVISINDLPSINYNVDFKGNLLRDNLSTNVKDYLKIEKIGDKNIARVKFSITALSLGEMTLRFSNVRFNNGAHCYVYTSDYEIVAGPVYEKSISNVLNIVKIPANELILEIVFNSVNDFDLILNTISYQSIIDISKKKDNSLQGAIPDSIWDCSSCDYGDKNFVDNVGDSYNLYGASLLGAGNDCELFNHSNLFSVNDKKLDAARASCIIMEPPHFDTETPPNWIDYWGANSGTLMNFPESDCKGIIFTSYHLGFIKQLCSLTVKENLGPISLEDQAILDNTIIRFNWNHKYGKPLHLDGCSQNDFALWRKTIDFDEVIDYCGVRGVAYATLYEDGDYAILRMLQTPFYKELHLGWSTQRAFDCTPNGDSLIMNHPEDFTILGRHAATPTYIYTNSRAKIFTYHDDGTHYTHGILQKVIAPGETIPKKSFFIGWSGSQILYPDYSDSLQRIGLGIIKGTGQNGDSMYLRSINYNYLFDLLYCYIIDTSLVVVPGTTKNSLYSSYLSQFVTSELNVENDFYWMPSKENREKCPSTVGGGTGSCNFLLTGSNKVSYVYDKGKIHITINMGSISRNNFPGGIYPKGIRIYNGTSDQKTFYFDTFTDNEDIDSLITFTIDQCDVYYFLNNGFNPIVLGFDFYDSTGRVLNDVGCDLKYKIPISPIDFCDILSVTTKKSTSPPNPCCSDTISIKFEGCSDYGNIIPMMLQQLTLKNMTTNVTIPINSLPNCLPNYLDGTINFTIDNICTETTFEIKNLYGNNNCDPLVFILDCEFPEPEYDCCHIYNGIVKPVYETDIEDSIPVRQLKAKMFSLSFTRMKNGTFETKCPDYQFQSAFITCTGPQSPPPVYYTNYYIYEDFPFGSNGSLEGYPIGRYCFNAEITTNHGICRDTFCINFDGTNWAMEPSEPDPDELIKITRDHDESNSLQISSQLDYEQISIVDINGKEIIESKPVENLDVSKLPKGTYNILYRKEDEIIKSQKLVIE